MQSHDSSTVQKRLSVLHLNCELRKMICFIPSVSKPESEILKNTKSKPRSCQPQLRPCVTSHRNTFKFFRRNLRKYEQELLTKSKSNQQALLEPDLDIAWSRAFLSRGNLYLIIIIRRASFLRPLHSTVRRKCHQKLLQCCHVVQN